MKAKCLLLISTCFIIMFGACSNAKTSTVTTDSITPTTDTVTAVTATTVTAAMPDNGIGDKKWKLIELMGKPVPDSVNGKEPFIMFKMDDSSYSANGGCNGLGGNFVLDEKTLRIQFKQGMSTMMACRDMAVEEGLKKVLSGADNYTVNDSILSLDKARMAPLARFRAVQ